MHTRCGFASILLSCLLLALSTCSLTASDDEDPLIIIQPDPFGATDYDPVWSPAGDWIAYRHGPSTRQGTGVYLIREDGSGEQLLVANGGTPSWSFDGKKLVLKAGGAGGVSILELSTMSMTHSAGLPYRIAHTSWHPNSERLLFSSGEGDKPGGIWDYVISTGTAVLLFESNSTNGGGNYPEWNPQGDTVVFVNSNIESYYLCLLEAPFSEVERLLDVEDLGGGQLRYPTFSPDGGKIAFSTTGTGDHEAKVWIYYLSIHLVIPVVDGGNNPSWSPDGKALVYVHHKIHTPEYGYDVEGNGMLWILYLGSGEHQQLTGR